MSKYFKLINEYTESIRSKRNGTIFALLIVAIFLALSLTRSYPYKNFQGISNAIGDDWGTYANNALDIKHNGILMPSAETAYCLPSGFLYNYFLAFFLVIFGEKSLPIYIAQHLMLGLSVALIYWTFRDKMRNLTSILFLCALFIFALKDVYKNYSPLLLSENLALFLMAAFFFCFVKGFEEDRFALQLVSAFLLGLAVLTRPNISIFSFLIIPLVAIRYFKERKSGLLKLTVFIGVLLLSSSFLFIRNYVALKEYAFFPSQSFSFEYFKSFHPVPPSVDLSKADTNILFTKLHLDRKYVNYVEYVAQKPRIFFGFYLKKIIFCLGYLRPLTPYYGLRDRWVIMWAGYFLYLFFRIRSRERPRLWEIAVNLYIATYYGSVIMNASVHNYGFRMLIPALFFVLVPAFISVDILCSKFLVN